MSWLTTALGMSASKVETRDPQGMAADPQVSAWVSANAGTGKTHVLTMRVLRLMLAGTAPDKILCLTYTKAAAAEMSTRVFDTLAAWVTTDDRALREALERVLGRRPEATETERARTLFTRAIETPGGLKVQTIHAFAERLLQRFPLEAGVTPGFEILDEAEARELRRAATDAVLARATRKPESKLGRALTAAIAFAADTHFDSILDDVLLYRDWLRATPADEARAVYCRQLGVRSSRTAEKVMAEIVDVLTEAQITALRAALASGTKSDVKLSAAFASAGGTKVRRQRLDALRKVFATAEGTARARLMTQATAAQFPSENELLTRAQARFLALDEERRGLEVVEATVALHRIGALVLAGYDEAKRRRAALDFDDLIEKTGALLATSGATEWVLHKLDAGLDHILVDESQDTSPRQWQIVEALAQEFFAGQGAREEARTVFAVGDEKQSIYSFQGAAPEMFAAVGARFAALAQGAGRPWRRVPLELSFRSVEAVLGAVDRVFANEARTPGVHSGGQGVRHVAKRLGQGGLIEIWPTETHAEPAPSDAWAPLEDSSQSPPAVRLAGLIADTIAGWLASGERLASLGRPVQPGDILILVRKRAPFAAPMVAALKARGVPVAGADRMRLMDHIAVQDLVSLLTFLTLPEDDLSLAEALKSPIFGLDDDDLMRFAAGRRGTLWSALIEASKTEPRFAAAAETLKRWRKAIDFEPPYEFLARLLDADGVRKALIARLGPDAADPIDELVTLALGYDDHAPPSLTGFLTWLGADSREIQRDMEHGRNEVRVMTVHGAKGLEAPIVFLPDTCGKPNGRRGGGPIAYRDPTDDDPASASAHSFLWPVNGGSNLPAVQAQIAHGHREDRAELDRLLYVAMTRARDRLYVAGFEDRKGRAANCWYDTIRDALADQMSETRSGAGSVPVLRLEDPQSASPEAERRARRDDVRAVPLPDWAGRKAPRETEIAIPLAPSRLAPYETDEAGDPLPTEPPRDTLAEPPGANPATLAGDARFLRGTITHALLQHLPGRDPSTWRDAARRFVAERGAGLAARVQKSIVTETLAVLRDPTFAPLFGPASRAEVPIVAMIPRPRGSGAPLKLGGQIDRLAEVGDEVLIVDYKTNRPPPATVAGVADVYLYQLAAYRLAVAEVYGGRSVRCALLWTDGPRLMEIPKEVLDSYAARLWDVERPSLDA